MYMCMWKCVNVYVCMCVCVCVVVCICVSVCVSVCVWKDGERTVGRAKWGETLVEASRDTNAQIVRYTFFMGVKDKSNHLTAGSFQRFPRITGASQLRQVKRMIGGSGNMLFSIYSQTENVQDPRVSLLNLWGRVRTLRGLFMVSRTGDDHPVCRFKNASVCRFKTSPCMPAPRTHVEKHVRVLPAYTGTVRMYTWRRFESTHWVFSLPHHAPHTTPHHATQTPHKQTTTHNDTHTHTTNTRRQR